MIKHLILIPAICLPFLFLSCKKDEKVVTPETPTVAEPSVSMNFDARVNGQSMQPDTWYLNFFADSFTVRRFNYYISNVKLKRVDGFVYSEPESYHLNKHIDHKDNFTLSNVPEGTYNAIEFLIGVDSLRNVSGAQTGDLAVSEQMFWEWNTGYIFFKLEGACKTADPNREDFAVHIGGFSGRDNAIQKCTFALLNPIVAEKGKKSQVYFQVNMEEIFKNPQNLDIETIMNGGGSILKTVASNYNDMFKVDRVQN